MTLKYPTKNGRAPRGLVDVPPPRARDENLRALTVDYGPSLRLVLPPSVPDLVQLGLTQEVADCLIELTAPAERVSVKVDFKKRPAGGAVANFNGAAAQATHAALFNREGRLCAYGLLYHRGVGQAAVPHWTTFDLPVRGITDQTAEE